MAGWLGYSAVGITFHLKEPFPIQPSRGDHLIYVKAGVRRPLVIPMYRAVPVFIIKNLLRTSGMDRDHYFELLTMS